MSFFTGYTFRSAGSEFFLAFLQGFNTSAAQLQLLVSTSEPSPVSFTVESLSREFSYNGSVSNTSVTVVDVPPEFQVEKESTGTTDQGLHVRAETGDITVIGVLEERSLAGTYLAFPCTQLASTESYEYYSVTYSAHSQSGSAVVLVGCEDNTSITINGSTSINLNRLQTHIQYDPSNHNDLTGTHYIADKPVSIFSGHPCTFVPDDITACDILIAQVPPTATWGRYFLSKSFEGRSSGELYRVLAAYGSTAVRVSCANTEFSNALSLSAPGSWEEFETPPNSYCSIESNYPVLVMQFMLGYNADEVTGDPLMVMIPPVDQYINQYNLYGLPAYDLTYITLYVAPEHYQPENIFLDGSSLELSEQWRTVDCFNGSLCGHIASFEIDEGGDHYVVHRQADGEVGVIVHGMARGISYAYIGGIQSQQGRCIQL